MTAPSCTYRTPGGKHLAPCSCCSSASFPPWRRVRVTLHPLLSQHAEGQRSAAKSTALPSPPASKLPLSTRITLTTQRAHISTPTRTIVTSSPSTRRPCSCFNMLTFCPDSRILGAPAWTKSSKYDIEGKSDPATRRKACSLAIHRCQASTAQDGAIAPRGPFSSCRTLREPRTSGL